MKAIMEYIRKNSITGVFVILMGLAMVIAGCKANNAQKGAVIGAGSGAVIGGVIGKNSDKTAAGVLIGATIGGAAGAVIGHQMDKQAEELRADLENAEVERVGEGIKITFDSGILFSVDSDDLSEESQRNLKELAATLKKYEDTDILVDGHTDATGPEKYNQELSEQRAASVQNFLIDQGVAIKRIVARGFGETAPVANNSSDQGRQENRRVEVAILANEKMRRAAENGTL